MESSDVDAYALIVVSISIVIGIGLGLLALRFFASALSEAIRGPVASALMMVIGLLTLVFGVGALLTSDESAWTVTAAGMGALAASLTTYVNVKATSKDDDDSDFEDGLDDLSALDDEDTIPHDGEEDNG